MSIEDLRQTGFSPTLEAMLLFWQLVLVLVFGLLVVRRHGRFAMLAALAWMAVTLPDVVRFVEYTAAGVDERQHFAGGRVDIRLNGPLNFTSAREGRRLGPSILHHSTTVPLATGNELITFTILGLNKSEAFDFSGCPLDQGPHGLSALTERGDGFCPARAAPTMVYVDSVNAGNTPFFLSCWPFYVPGAATEERCAMTLNHNGMSLNVAMRELPRSSWPHVLGHVTAILDQSFTPVSDASLPG